MGRPGCCGALLLPLAVVVCGCQPAPTSDPLFWDRSRSTVDAAPITPDSAVRNDTRPRDTRPPPDTRVPDTRRPDAEPMTTGDTCTLVVKVTTVATGVAYSPRNVGAIWIEDAAGKFVKTLKLWANRRIQHLLTWNEVTSAAGVSRNVVDAVTSATQFGHSAQSATWNCTDINRAGVPDGTYSVCFEMTESNSAGGGEPPRDDCVSFDKQQVAFKVAPPDVESFIHRSIDYVP